MKCLKCQSERVFSIGAKASDLFNAVYVKNGKAYEKDGYAPDVENVCGGDYIDISVCLECGQMQGSWPVADPDVEEKNSRGEKQWQEF